MNNNELAEPPTTFDNTMISMYCECERKLYWFLRGVRPEITPPYFSFGRAWGRALGVWHTTLNLDPRARKNAAIDAARKLWQDEAPVESGDNTLANLIFMIDLYTNVYKETEPWEVFANEIGFCLEIPDTNYFYAGALDAEIMWKDYGVLVREDKTTGQWIGPSLLKQWDYSTQVTGYQWAIETITKKEAFGILMNYASKKNRKDNELRFSRDLVKRTKSDITNWLEETKTIISRIRNEWITWTWIPTGMRNPMCCAGGPGKSSCTYQVLCKDQRHFTKIEPEKFQGLKVIEEVWKPWERLGED